jgi:hypothetical protein
MPGMDVSRLLAGALAVNRTAFGANYLARPQSAGPSWIGRVAGTPGAQVMIRSQGARDVALGLGALWALGTRGDTHSWMVAHALADGADTVATWAARKRLPNDGRLALALAAGSTVVAVAAAAGLRPTKQSPDVG